ncbi:MAG: carbohydrate ABC transporter permease [Massiliimalia sp.]|jgi:raffinose/stachyose/melibiose transport system permease protein
MKKPLFKSRVKNVNPHKQGWIIFWFLLPALIMFCLVYLWPLFLSIGSSFCSWNGFEDMKFIGLKNYIELFQDDNFSAAMWNTIKWALCAAFIHVPWGVLVALVLAKKMRGWRFVRSAFMVPNIISQSGMALLFMFIFKPDAGILNSVIKIFAGDDFNINWLYDQRTAFFALTQIWLWFAAVITLITLAELLSISPDLYEAAKIDGANVWQIDWYINIPLLRNIIGTGMIIAITSVFKMFDIIYMTTNGGPGNETINLAVMSVNAIVVQSRYGYANAIGIVMLLMGVIVMLVIQKGMKTGQSTAD